MIVMKASGSVLRMASKAAKPPLPMPIIVIFVISNLHINSKIVITFQVLSGFIYTNILIEYHKHDNYERLYNERLYNGY